MFNLGTRFTFPSLNIDIYVGTDVGVFYKKDSDITWQYYGTGMPNTQVSDLEIYYPTGKLRAGTYGRGIWENDIARHITPLNVGQVKVALSSIQLIQNPVNSSLKRSICHMIINSFKLHLLSLILWGSFSRGLHTFL